MKLCYLVNLYPKVSHSFIRREILELERQGAEVFRVALRGWDHAVEDAEDVLEKGRTRYVLRGGWTSLLGRSLQHLVVHPLRFLATARETIALARTSDRALWRHLVALAEACVVSAWAKAAGCQHVHAHFGTNSAEVAMLASLLSGIPYSFTVHGPEEFDHPAGLCLGRKMRHAALVVAISSFGRSQLYRWAAVEHWSKIHVVRCGLDANFLDEPRRPSPLSTTFVCVGRLCEQKGQLLLLEALRRLLERGLVCQLVLAGDGELRAQVEQRAQELGVSGSVSITGWIASDKVKQQILGARALVLPSFAEGLPVVLMEAMALCCPVITTSIAGIPELVRRGESGWLVPAGDVEGLADAMAECLAQDQVTLSAMGDAGRQRVLARHDIRNEATRLLALFKRCR